MDKVGSIVSTVLTKHDSDIKKHGCKAKSYIYEKIILPLCVQYGDELKASLVEKYTAADKLWYDVYSNQFTA
jgi:hypothetical protein